MSHSGEIYTIVQGVIHGNGENSVVKADSSSLVSIIINNYNYGRFLADAIDSALNQEYPFVEVIVVDDGSTDNSREIIESYGDRITAVFKENGRQASCFNVGFERCHGDIVIFLDSDDFLFPKAATLVAERMVDSSISKCNGYLQIVDTEGKPTGRRLPKRLSPSGRYTDSFLKHGPWTYVGCYTSGNAWSRSFLNRVMPLPTDERVQGGADGYLTAIDGLYGKIETIDELIGGYRIHGGNFLPTFRQFSADKLTAVLSSEEARAQYAAMHAEKLGYNVDHEAWIRRDSWLLLIRYALFLMGRPIKAPSLLEHLRSSFYKESRSLLSSIKILFAILVIRLSPKSIALELSRRVLRYSKAQA
jgi:glycosyltransferase involved in cell wall biosynthesis